MRQLHLAVLVGVLLGVGLLAYDLSQPSSASFSSAPTASDTLPKASKVTFKATRQPTSGPSAHEDANTEITEISKRRVLLNERVIRGQQTLICIDRQGGAYPTADIDSLYQALDGAVRHWETELGLDLFTIIDRRASTAARSCTGANAPEFDVLIRFGTDCSTLSMSTNPNITACYRHKKSDLGKLPRRLFRHANSTEHSVIVYEGGRSRTTSAVQPSTMRHELGHVIGLSDYLDSTCQGLHVPPVPPVRLGTSRTFADRDVDRDDDHKSLMLSNAGARGCRVDFVTGRDKRDFYEEYQPGAVTDVRPSLTSTSDPLSGSTETTKTLSLSWTDDGLSELKHNAYHIAVIGRYATAPASGRELRELGTVLAVKIPDERGTPLHGVTIAPRSDLDQTEYLVAGVTRGGLASVNGVKWTDVVPSGVDRMSTRVLGTDRWFVGDPAYVFGDLWNSAGPRLYLVVAVSPNACYISGTGVPRVTKNLPATWAVGSNTAPSFSADVNLTVTIGGADAHDEVSTSASGTQNIPCSGISSGTSIIDVPITVTAEATLGNSSSQTITKTVNVQDRNHDRTVRFSTPLTATPSPCVSGQTVTVRWARASNSLPATIRMNGVEATSSPATFTCPSEPAGDGNIIYVSAVASDGSGAVVPIVIQAPQPTGVTASTSVTATAATATLTWTAPAGVSNASYGLWRSRGQSTSTTSTSYTFTGLIPYETYNLHVWTVNAAGVGSPSVSRRVTMPARPGVARTAAPTGLRASAITTNSATLSWNAVAGATGYRVWRSSGSEITLASTARSYTFTGLSESRNYSLMVWAIGNGGISPNARVAINTLGPKPDQPTGLRAATSVTATTATATLTWSAVSGAANYRVWRSQGQSATTTGTSYTFSGLMPYETYNLYVWALDSSSRQSAYARVTITMPGRPGVPRTGPPSGLSTSGLTSTSVTLNWSPGSGVSKYAVWRSKGSTVRLDSSARSYTFQNLTPGTRYALMVWAEGNGGVSVWKRRYITTPALVTTPPPPTGLRISSATANSLTLRWNAATGATSYEVKRSGSSTVRTVSSERVYRFAGLTTGTSYTLYVRAKNSSGASAWVSKAKPTVPARPGVPRIAATHNTLTLIWPSVRGATSYQVKRGLYGTATTVASGRTYYTFRGLLSNASYTLYVRARNASGASAWRSHTDTTKIPDPTGLGVAATSSTLTLSWTADARAFRYQVKRQPGGTVLMTTGSSYTFRGLSADTPYTLSVQAVSAAGATWWSSISGRTLASAAPTTTSLVACLSTTTLDTFATWSSGDSHCSNGGSASALWADLRAASVAVGCISHWNTSTSAWVPYQSGSGWSSFTIPRWAVLWLSSTACSGSGGASGSSGASDTGSPSCTDAVRPSAGPTVVQVGGSACVIIRSGGAAQVSDGARTLNLTLSAGRDWLVLAASDFAGGSAGAFLFVDLSSGGWLALNPADGGELARYAPAGAAGLPALLNAIVNSASTE